MWSLWSRKATSASRQILKSHPRISQITSKDFYAIYELWCDDNTTKPVTSKSFSTYLSQHEQEYNLEHNNNVRNNQGRRVWGFWGIEPIVKVFV